MAWEHLPSSLTYCRTSQMLMEFGVLNTLVNQLQLIHKPYRIMSLSGYVLVQRQMQLMKTVAVVWRGEKQKKPKPSPLVEGNAFTRGKAASAKRTMHLYDQYHSQSRQEWELAQ